MHKYFLPSAAFRDDHTVIFKAAYANRKKKRRKKEENILLYHGTNGPASFLSSLSECKVRVGNFYKISLTQ